MIIGIEYKSVSILFICVQIVVLLVASAGVKIIPDKVVGIK